MSIPNYRVVLSFDAERKVFVARAPELEHCTGEGATRGEAIDKIEKEIEAQIQNMQERGQRPAPAIPAAIDDTTFTGELTARVSRTLQRDLAWQARQEGVDLDHLLGEILAAGLDARRQPRRGNRAPDGNSIGNTGPGHDGNQRSHTSHGNYDDRPRQGYGARYHGIMDDRANFIEYVRGLEAEGHGQGRPANRGHRPGGPGPREGRPGGPGPREAQGGDSSSSGPGNGPGQGANDRDRGRRRGGRNQGGKRWDGPGHGGRRDSEAPRRDAGPQAPAPAGDGDKGE